MTPDLAELKRIAEAATPFEDADQLSVLKAYIGATPPSVVLALIARIEALEAGLKSAAARFRHYEQLHAAKGSPDGDAKAQNNADMAQMIEALLGDRHD